MTQIKVHTPPVKTGKFDNRNRNNNDDLLEDLEEDLEEDPDEDKDEEENDDSRKNNDPEDNDEHDADEEEDLEDEDVDEEEEKRKAAAEEDRKKKERASQQEAIVQNARNKQLTEKIKAAQSLDVTDDELKAEAAKEGLDFDTLDNFQRSMLKRTILAERKFSTVSSVVVADDKLTEWHEKIDSFLDKEETLTKYPRLAGHEEDFVAFAMKETRRGGDLDDLVGGFLYNLPAGTKQKKSSIFLRGGGGEKKTKKGLDAQEVSMLRKTDPKRYHELVRKNLIKIEV